MAINTVKLLYYKIVISNHWSLLDLYVATSSAAIALSTQFSIVAVDVSIRSASASNKSNFSL